jgi:hypothetical protein
MGLLVQPVVVKSLRPWILFQSPSFVSATGGGKILPIRSIFPAVSFLPSFLPFVP